MQILNGYEESLHLVRNYERREALIDKMRQELQAAVVDKAAMQQLLAQMEG